MEDLFGGNNYAADADNLVLNLADVEEKSAGFEALPAGIYEAVIEGTEFKTSANGNPMIAWQFTITEAPYTNRRIFTHTVLNNPTGVSILKKILVRVLPDQDLTGFKPASFCDNGVAIGMPCRLKLKIKVYKGERRNEVSEVLAATSGGSFLDV